ncbi:adenylate/guanylate cyclase domain-containing protein [Mycobacterium heckeshornense]|uniref:Adenylate/guanylate cyclase domain-containing protein n=1 Tax=Mycobacterium heckeshornense TaxID=110505 RepID=A0A2G8BAT5_9MYCO|nr:adenylate/guanylate cyclase domain-containing protein [Mycobacterium heckeshornense]KMV21709.1 guanylate cyclase [Mycobacterium heckeshornense]MCV7036946.1 adenylate/guanylate cyclase domain-containing protein [Mycobacterium heckeshornense]PIJ34865.1 adenylate/guanylate cyclase domain-containing protein [Mycobacterium heckeshornense]BCO36059.1 adenylate/guanylate cyclase domain-containing protein [Mycobacterium heckeshornense]
MLGKVELGPDPASGKPEQAATVSAARDSRRLSPVQWLRSGNENPKVVELLRRARRALPGDPEFGDPLSTAGDGGPRAAARAAGRVLGGAASREVGLGALQLWQALTEAVSRRPANPEVTLVFTDLVGFSEWSLNAGDDAALKLLRRAARAVEPPLLDAGGRIVKRMGDGIMAVFDNPVAALRGACAAEKALKSVHVDGYTPRMRLGIHTGHPRRVAADWLGVDVNIAARVMERATKGGIMVSGPALDKIPQSELDRLGVVAKRAHRPLFGGKPSGVPTDMVIYRIETSRELTGAGADDDTTRQA